MCLLYLCRIFFIQFPNHNNYGSYLKYSRPSHSMCFSHTTSDTLKRGPIFRKSSCSAAEKAVVNYFKIGSQNILIFKDYVLKVYVEQCYRSVVPDLLSFMLCFQWDLRESYNLKIYYRGVGILVFRIL